MHHKHYDPVGASFKMYTKARPRSVVQHLVQPSFWPYYIPISNKVRSPAWKTPRQEGQRGNDYPIEHALNADRARVQRHIGAYRPRYYTYTKPPWPAKLLSALTSKPLTRAAYFRVPPPWLNPASCILIKVPRGLWGLAHTHAGYGTDCKGS